MALRRADRAMPLRRAAEGAAGAVTGFGAGPGDAGGRPVTAVCDPIRILIRPDWRSSAFTRKVSRRVRSSATRVTAGLFESSATRTRLTAPPPGISVVPLARGVTPVKSRKILGGSSSAPDTGCGRAPAASMVTIVRSPWTDD